LISAILWAFRSLFISQAAQPRLSTVQQLKTTNTKQFNSLNQKTNTVNIEEIKTAATTGDIDKIYQLIESESPTDTEREQLKEIATQHIDTNPEVAVAITLGTDEEFGRKIYERLLLNNQVDALRVMSDGEIPGYDTPLEDVLLLIAEHSSAEVWEYLVSSIIMEEAIAKLIGKAAVVAAEKNSALYEHIKASDFAYQWDGFNLQDYLSWPTLREANGADWMGAVGAIYADPEVFKKLIEAYQPYLPQCAVAAAESGRIDNLEALADFGYDLSSYPLDRDNGTLADIAALGNQTATVDWLISKGVKRDF
jgi:hypothetical protein